MAISIVGTALVTEVASDTKVTITYPTTITAGNLLLLSVTNSQQVAPATTPAGWTFAASQNSGGVVAAVSMYYKIATGSETGSFLIDPVQSAAGRITGIISQWSGVNTTTPLDITATTNTSAGSTTFTMPSVTTVTHGSVVLHTVAQGSSSSSDILTPSGLTQEAYTSGTSGRDTGLYSELKSTAGSVGSRTWSNSPATAIAWSGITLAIKPAEPGGSVPTQQTIIHSGTPTMGEAGSGALTADIAYPAGIVANEVLVLTVTATASAISTTPPGSGWSLAKANQNAAANTVSGAIFYRIATGTETGTLTVSPYAGTGASATGGRITLQMYRFSGVDLTSPLDVAGVSGGSGNALSYTHPTITTATTGAVVVYSVAFNSSSGTSRITTSDAALTKIGSGPSANVGRETQTFIETKDTPGLVGPRSFSDGGVTSSQWGGVSIALKAAGSTGGGGGGGGGTDPDPDPEPDPNLPPVPVPVLNRNVGDVPTATSMAWAVNTTNAISVRVKCATDTGLTTGVVYGTYVVPDSLSNSQISVQGLTANTRYYYRIQMKDANGVAHLDNWSTLGEFKTDINGGTMNFTIGFGSCLNGSDSVSLGAMAAKKPDLFLHLGDEFYADGSGTGISNFRSKMNAKKTAPNHKKIYRVSGSSMTPSDHDGMNNDSNYGDDATGWTNWNAVYREMNPNVDLPADRGVYRSFKRGRVRILRIDRRSRASATAASDTTSKSSLGATQTAWLKDQITNCQEPVILIQQADPWIEGAEAGEDGWNGFTAERSSLASFFAASGKNILMVAGDMHALAAHSGGSGSPGGVALFHAAPFYMAASQKGGPYTVGPYPSSGSTFIDQYGWINVTDTGTQISFAFTGYSSSNTARVSLTKTYNVSPPVQPDPVATVNLNGSGTLSVTIGSIARSGLTNLSGSGTFQPVPITLATTRAVSFTGSGTLSVEAEALTGQGPPSAFVTRTGSGQLTTVRIPVFARSLALSGSGQLSAFGSIPSEVGIYVLRGGQLRRIS